MESGGAPGVCTTAIMPQNPPFTVYSPRRMTPASGWPAVPLMVYTPPVLDRPPPSTVDHLFV